MERVMPVDFLLVEDSEEDIELTLHALRARNLANRMQVARDGEQTLAFIDQCRNGSLNHVANMPKLILLDLKLPKVNGLEIVRRLKSDSETASIPIVVLTSSQEDGDIKTAYSLGVNSYIVKPVDFAKFAEAVSQVGMYWLFLNEPPVL